MHVSFFSEQYKTIVPFLVIGKRYEAIESVARLLTSDVSDVLSSCMIDILVHILPLFAVTRHPQLSADAALTQQARYAYFTSYYDVSARRLTEFVRRTGYRDNFPASLRAELPPALQPLLDR